MAQYDTIFKNATLVNQDGEGGADIGIIQGRIAALGDGRLSPQRATASTCPVEVGRWMAGQFDTSDTPVSTSAA